MSDMNRLRPDDDPRHETEPRAAAAAPRGDSKAAAPPFDWQVLLLRYLPQPAGSAHVIKRLAPR
jgi:hypothetical protein